jgi:hypothetical protein
MRFAELQSAAPISGWKFWASAPLPKLLYLLFLIGTGCNRPNDKVETGPFVALGNVMSTQTSHLCNDNGSLVILVAEADANNSASAAGQALDAFRKALPKSMKVLATESLPISPVLISGAEPLPPAKFIELLQKHSAADALVSFVGIPPLTPEQMAQLPSPRPKVVEVIVFGPPTKAMFAQKVVDLAALSRPVSDPAPPGQSSLQELFDSHYQLVTPETAGSYLSY